MRVRKRKIFLGTGSKNHFPVPGPGKDGGVKNATGTIFWGRRARREAWRKHWEAWRKRREAWRRHGGKRQRAGTVYMERAGARVCARDGGGWQGHECPDQNRRREKENRCGNLATAGNIKAELPTIGKQLRYSVASPINHSRVTPRTRANIFNSKSATRRLPVSILLIAI